MTAVPEMVLRVARAICCPSGECRSERKAARRGTVVVCWASVHYDEARAAVVAMREPTQKMIDAYCYDMYEPVPRDQYQDMIDAALE